MKSVWIKGDDLKILDVIFTSMGWSSLPPSSMVLCYVDDKGLAAFHCLQVMAHPEPQWIREDMRGTGLSADMAAEMNEFLIETNTNRIMCVADKPEIAKLCESLGMRKINSPVYVRG